MLLRTLLPLATLAFSVLGAPHEARSVGALDAGAFAGSGAGSRRITALQHLLGDHQAVAVDGVWGPETAGAVSAFQGKSGLEADSVPGPATLGALASVVQQGSSGNGVRAAQAALAAGLDVDGEFGPATHAAAVQYQRGQGIDADGIVGRVTWSRLFGARGGGGGDVEAPPREGGQGGGSRTDVYDTSGRGRCLAGFKAVQNGVPPIQNGCGPKSFNVKFTAYDLSSCCNEHDVCYATCAKGKTACDTEWLECMKRTCRLEHNVPMCYAAAETLHAGVKNFGNTFFAKATRDHCKCIPTTYPVGS